MVATVAAAAAVVVGLVPYTAGNDVEVTEVEADDLINACTENGGYR